MLTTSLLVAVFLGALVSGWHCALMCGGIAAAIERPIALETPLRPKSELFYLQLIMHLGRVTTYVLLGALAASVGVVVLLMLVLLLVVVVELVVVVVELVVVVVVVVVVVLVVVAVVVVVVELVVVVVVV